MARPGPTLAETPDDAAEYARWLERRIVHGLAQAQDRAAMIPAEEVWRALDVED